MTAPALLAELRQRGVTVRADGGKLRFVAPRGTLTDELRQAIQRNRASLLALLAAEQTQEDDPRPDLAGDSHLWRTVLAHARRIDPDPTGPGSLHALLHGLRCGGARLRWTDAGRLKLDTSPLEGPDAWDHDELREQWLMPAREGITAAIRAAEQAHQHSRHLPWRDCTPQEAQEEAAAYAERGWVAIFSEALQEAIILARDEEAAQKAPKGFVTYTAPEVATLAPLSPEELRQVHAVKRCFGGRAIALREDGLAAAGEGFARVGWWPSLEAQRRSLTKSRSA